MPADAPVTTTALSVVAGGRAMGLHHSP
jgi:hypothetical protein